MRSLARPSTLRRAATIPLSKAIRRRDTHRRDIRNNKAIRNKATRSKVIRNRVIRNRECTMVPRAARHRRATTLIIEEAGLAAAGYALVY